MSLRPGCNLSKDELFYSWFDKLTTSDVSRRLKRTTTLMPLTTDCRLTVDCRLSTDDCNGFAVADLVEALVPQPDGVERHWHQHTHHLVGHPGEPLACLRRPYRNGDD